MPIRTAEATWNGGFPKGDGTMKTGSGAVDGTFSFGTRMQEEPGTNPEELIAAAEAGCFSMALAATLTKAGHEPRSIETRALVHLDKVGEGFAITRIQVETEGDVPGIDDKTFRDFAEKAKTNCVVSKALTGTVIELKATLTRSGASVAAR